MKSNELKHLCHVCYRIGMFEECNNYLYQIIERDKRLDRDLIVLLSGNFRKIYFKIKKRIKILENEYKKLILFSQEENSKEYDIDNNNLYNEYGLNSKEDSELISSFNKDLIKIIFHNKLELKHKTVKFIELVDFLIKNSNSNLDKALYDKMKGDFNRYIINIVNEEEKNQFYEESEGSYVKGIDRLKDYPYSEPIKLSLYLNYAVLLFEEKDLKEDAFDCLNICIKQCRDLELNDEGTEILNLIKENYEVWKIDNSNKIKPIDILEQYKENEIMETNEINKKNRRKKKKRN